MSLRITFELGNSDLNHFRAIMREAREAAVEHTPDEILQAAHGLLESVKGVEMPDFIRGRLEKITTMIEMVEDAEWKLPEEETARVLNALAYFSEPEDLIPDHVPGLGFLDDAIMVELVCRELRHEIEAYQDFCRFREDEEKSRTKAEIESEHTREEWLAARRQELHLRMRNRRRRERQRRRTRAGSRRSPFSLF